MDYQKLFNYMKDEHGVTLLESDMQEIRNIVSGHESEQCNIPDVGGSFLYELKTIAYGKGSSSEKLEEIKEKLSSK